MSLLREDIEYSVHCDEKGKVIGPISKVHAHLPGVRETLTHYSSWSMIFNPVTGKYGIQQKNARAHDKKSAGLWDMGVAGHNLYVKDGKGYRYIDFEENLAKEAQEEIGMKLKIFSSKKEFIEASKNLKEAIGFIIEKFHYSTDKNKEWVGLGLILTPSEEVNFTDGEVRDFKWLTPKELQSYLDSDKNYCGALGTAFEKSEKFRKEELK